VRQFELWWASLPAPAGRRPVLLLSRNPAYAHLNKFIVAEVTTRVRGIAVEVALGPSEGMKKPCAVNCDNLHTVSRECLSSRIGSLAVERRVEVRRAVGYATGWFELMDL
jgi:mRNA interferase MazF